MLRLNKDQTAYEALVAPLRVSGRSTMVLSVYDFREFRVAEYRTNLIFESDDRRTDVQLSQDDNLLRLWPILATLLLLIVLLIGWLILLDRDSEEDEDTDATVTD